MTKTRITGVIDEIMRMKSSPSGNPRYVVTINGTHYRTIPDSDFAYEVPNLVGKHVELFLRKLHGREQIMYGGEIEVRYGKPSPPPKPEDLQGGPELGADRMEELRSIAENPWLVATLPARVDEEFMAAAGSSQAEEHAFLMGFYQWLAMKPELRTLPAPHTEARIAYDNGRAMAQAVHNHLTGQEEE